jgi:predicted alpha-1,6-mannanase (GH76 family)
VKLPHKDCVFVNEAAFLWLWGCSLHKRLVLLGVILCASAVGLCAIVRAEQSPNATSKYLDQATQGINTLQGWYNSNTGLYHTTGWWNSANAITVLADYSRAAGTSQYASTFAITFKAAQTRNSGFINNYYDDEGWWALAWIDAYDLTHTPQYLSMAQSIFTNMANGWDTTTCGGGIWWSKDKTYKNAVANELFLSVAAHLANRTVGTEKAGYAQWAHREWNWFLASGMINPHNLVNDGLDSSDPTACKNNNGTTWTYNQGIVLGGLAEFSQLEKDPSLLANAQQIATAAITHLTDASGILHDPCEPNCGADGPQFKGIFARNLMTLYQDAPNLTYKAFLNQNANRICNNDQGSGGTFGLIWSGPFDSADAARQSSALDAIVAAATVNAKN